VLAVAAIAGYGTYSFFSDTEKSSGNTFTAGNIDLKVDSQAHYAGLVCKLVDSVTYHWVQDGTQTVTRPDLLNQPCSGSWAQTDLGPTNKFFSYADVKPGDPGENTISLHTTNDAWMCANMKVTSNADGAGNASVASSLTSDFEPTYTVGNINGQHSWLKTGSFDANVSATGIPASFGTQSLQISDAVTSGSFGDQTFSPSLANEAGETDALNNGLSGGTRQKSFVAQFDIASVLPTLQAGMHVSVSPDRGDGSRMSYLRFEDHSASDLYTGGPNGTAIPGHPAGSNYADGINVFFDDVQGTSNPANFVETEIATISRTPHNIKFAMDFVDGPSNDVVKIYIDGTLIQTGTSWENYYRFDPESNPSLISNSRTVDSLLFRESGTANSSDAGKGFLIDNLSLKSGSNLSGGALADGIQFATWVDNSSANGAVPGDNIHQAGETLLFGPTALGSNGMTIPLADKNHGPAFTANDTHNIGIAWCAGTMHVDNVTGAITCDGSTMGNEAQNDSMTADVTLTAEQSRNNPNFLCQ